MIEGCGSLQTLRCDCSADHNADVAVIAQMLMVVAVTAVEIYLLDCSPARASSIRRHPPSSLPPADCRDALAVPSSGGMDLRGDLHSSLCVGEADLNAAVRVWI